MRFVPGQAGCDGPGFRLGAARKPPGGEPLLEKQNQKEDAVRLNGILFWFFATAHRRTGGRPYASSLALDFSLSLGSLSLDFFSFSGVSPDSSGGGGVTSAWTFSIRRSSTSMTVKVTFS